MAITLERFRAEAAGRRNGGSSGTRRYSTDLVAFAVDHAQRLVASGRSLHSAAVELGVSMTVLQSWRKREQTAPTGKLRKVVVDRAPAAHRSSSSSALTLTTSSGHVVSGLDVAQAAELLRALS